MVVVSVSSSAASTAASVASKRSITSAASASASTGQRGKHPAGLGRTGKSISSTRLSPSPLGSSSSSSTSSRTTTTTTTTRRRSYSNNYHSNSTTRIRSSLLHKLGIQEDEDTTARLLMRSRNNTPRRTPKSLLGNVPILTQPLKYVEEKDHPADDPHCTSPSTSRTFWQFLGVVGVPPSTSQQQQQQQQQEDDDDEDCCHPTLSPCTSDSSMSTASVSTSSNHGGGGGIKFNEDVTVIPIPKRNEYSDRIRDRLWCNVQELNTNAQRNTIEFAAEGWDWRTTIEDDGMYVCTESGEKIHPVHVEYQTEE